METNLIIQEPLSDRDDTFDALISQIASESRWARVSVAVAYATVSGVIRLHEVIYSSNPNVCFRWLLGIDDYITSPGAVEFCSLQSKSDVRIYKSIQRTTRFHPKMYLFEEFNRMGGGALLIVGSANLTIAALERNCEAGAIVWTSSKSEAEDLIASYDRLWQLGKEPTNELMAQYMANYQHYQGNRSFLRQDDVREKSGVGSYEVLEHDAAEKSPEASNICWIEVGKNTAMGRELEFKAEQARFFGLNPQGGDPEYRDFLVSNGEVVLLRLKYQDNHMWRLQLNRNVPEVATGLRPENEMGQLDRSPYVAIFERIDGNKRFRLHFQRVNSSKHRHVRSQSAKIGTIGKTTAREYGWY